MKVWDTLAIGEFLNEVAPNAGLLPKGQQSVPIVVPFAVKCILALYRCARPCR